MNLDVLTLSILGPAFLAGVLVLATHVPLGVQVLGRGIIFIDLAIAQVAGLGVVIADRLGLAPQGWGVEAAAVAAALTAALLLTWTEKRWPEVQEATIGVLFALAASLALLLMAGDPHGGEHLKDLLVGQILWVSYGQLAPVALFSALILAVWFGLGERLGRLGFYVLFAFAITVSVQLVGVYLVFSSLIVPALATRRLTGRARLFAAYALGVAAYGVGLALSALFDFPSGAVIVLALVGLALPLHALGPKVGQET